MSYEQFANLYDKLMEDAPYESWLQYMVDIVNEFNPKAKRVLDVGCGTGELLIRYLKNGFEAEGVDLSANMLAVAQEKLNREGLNCPLFEQDMRSLEGLGTFDVITVFCDSLNYLETEEDVIQAFQQFYQLLPKNGLLLFDVHSLYKIHYIFKEATFAEDTGDIAYIWNVFEGQYDNSVEHELSFFVKEQNDLFAKYEETHIKRTFSIKDYVQWLNDANFTLLKISGDFNNEICETTERILFALRRN